MTTIPNAGTGPTLSAATGKIGISSCCMGGPFGSGCVRTPLYADRAARHSRWRDVLPHRCTVRLSDSAVCAMADQDHPLQLPLSVGLRGDFFRHPGVLSAGLPRMSRGPFTEARKAWGEPVGSFFHSEA